MTISRSENVWFNNESSVSARKSSPSNTGTPIVTLGRSWLTILPSHGSSNHRLSGSFRTCDLQQPATSAPPHAGFLLSSNGIWPTLVPLDKSPANPVHFGQGPPSEKTPFRPAPYISRASNSGGGAAHVVRLPCQIRHPASRASVSTVPGSADLRARCSERCPSLL